MLLQILFLIFGLAFVIKGGDLFVDASISISKILNIPRVVIGGTIVSLATTTPELVVSSMASVMGDSGIAIGNAVGSAIANIGLIVGVVCLLSVIKVDMRDFSRRALWMFVALVSVILFSWDLSLGTNAGLVLVAISLAYLGSDLIGELRRTSREKKQDQKNLSTGLRTHVVLFVVGIIMVAIGSRWLVNSGVSIASMLGIPSVIIGLTVVAVGTSMPELVTGITAARKGAADLSIGNIIGANVLNLSLISGVAAIIHPLTLTTITKMYSFPFVVVMSLFVWFVTRPDGVVKRHHGVVLITLYALYTIGLVILPFISRV